jgi:hypothetical protein
MRLKSQQIMSVQPARIEQVQVPAAAIRNLSGNEAQLRAVHTRRKAHAIIQVSSAGEAILS